jgi:predicted porin
MRTSSFLLAAALMCAGVAHAATLYVDDKLVLNVYEEPSQSSARITTIETGDAVGNSSESIGSCACSLQMDAKVGWARIT